MLRHVSVVILNLIKPHRYAQHKMRPTVSDVAWSVHVCIGWSCSVSCAEINREATRRVDLRGKWITYTSWLSRPPEAEVIPAADVDSVVVASVVVVVAIPRNASTKHYWRCHRLWILYDMARQNLLRYCFSCYYSAVSLWHKMWLIVTEIAWSVTAQTKGTIY